MNPETDDLKHVPVMLREILSAAERCLSRYYHESSDNYQPGSAGSPLILDCTLGEAGHTVAFLKKFHGVKIIAFDQDPQMIGRASVKIAASGFRLIQSLPEEIDSRGIAELFRQTDSEGRTPDVIAVNIPFSEGLQLMSRNPAKADFILMDLGVSLFHFSGAGRGFSYNDETLDMRLSPEKGKTAAQILAELSESEIANIIYKYGEEKESRIIARKIKENMPVTSAKQLAKITADAVRKKSPAPKGRSVHPATRVFQALRIYVNDELGELERALASVKEILTPGGMIAVISFHSLEDRIVKHTFREWSGPRRAKGNKYRQAVSPDPGTEFTDYGSSPALPSEEESRINPPSRSAKLRILRKI